MDYRSIGKTNLKLSALSYGCMRFGDDESAAAAVKKAIGLGVNYFDIAPGYCGCVSEQKLGLGLKGEDLSKLIITAKSTPGDGGEGVGGAYRPDTGNGIDTADKARAEIERSMQAMGVDHFNVYHLWAVHHDRIFDEAMKPGGFLEGVVKAQSEGLVDHIGVTGHVSSESFINMLERFPFDMITIPFHLRDISRAKVVDYCAKRGIGVIAMNPLAGGALAGPAQILKSIAAGIGCSNMTEASLRYLIGYPGVTTSIVGFSYARQVEEDALYADKGGLSPEAMNLLQTRVSELYANVRHFCSACGYCGECPEGVLIPKVLEVYSNLLVPSIAEATMQELLDRLSRDGQGFDPALCVACGHCEPKCPNHLPVSELMSAAKDKWPA